MSNSTSTRKEMRIIQWTEISFCQDKIFFSTIMGGKITFQHSPSTPRIPDDFTHLNNADLVHGKHFDFSSGLTISNSQIPTQTLTNFHASIG